VFTALSGKQRTATELARDLGLPGERLELLLYSLAAADLLVADGDRFTAAPETSRILDRNSPAFVGDVHKGFRLMWEAALKTSETLRSGSPRARIDFSAMNEEQLESFYRGFYAAAVAAGRDLANAHDLSGARSLVDVGGGSGGFAVAMVERWPELEVTVADLPAVIPITERFLAAAGTGERVRAVATDVVKHPLRGSYDVAVLRALIQVLSPDEARRVLRNVAESLSPGGTIFILGRVLEDSRLQPLSSVLSNVVFLNIFPEGQAYTKSQYRAWVEEAGFVDVTVEISSDGRGTVRARKDATRG